MNKRELTKTIISELREDNEIKNLKFKVKQEEFLGAFCPCAFEIETATGIFRAEVEETFVSLSFEKENVRKIILNKHKLELIEKMQDGIFQEALKNNDFEIF